MRIEELLNHHGIAANPFADEDAQTDLVFKDHCIRSTRHPTWDKVYGNPTDPATAVVFGEKGAGKTALRLQIVRHAQEHNAQHPGRRLYIIQYDDFNPFLDHFRDRLSIRKRRPEQVLAQWRLWDHIDAILAIGVTQLVDQLLAENRFGKAEAADADSLAGATLSRSQARDLLLLAACYDQSPAAPFRQRWNRLRRRLKFSVWKSFWPLALGTAVALATVGLILGRGAWSWLATVWPYLFVAAGFLPWLYRQASCLLTAAGITRQLRVIRRQINPLRQVLSRFTPDELAGQPLPTKERSDDRYELLARFQGALSSLGYPGVLVIVDRADEPHLINGSPERMKAFLWPLLDNKFLKHPGIGFKLLLPIELSYFIEREDRDFHQRARLDKQNMIPSLEWSGEALHDVANARLRACAANGKQPSLRALLDGAIGDHRLIDSLRSLRTPRHMFKFLHRLFVAHASAHTDANPSWQISAPAFESVLALYQREQDAAERR